MTEKNFDLYTEDGWFDFGAMMEYTKDYPFVIINGGRGTGKTFGALKWVRENPDNGQFIYLRRTQVQLDTINKQQFSPFNDVDALLGTSTIAVPLSKYNAGYYNSVYDDEKEKMVPVDVDHPIGISCALSTISNLRSFSASNITTIIYDEYIPEAKDKPIKNEADALLNAYETVNRNRELAGKQPVKLVLMANTNRIDNPVLSRLNIVDILQKMDEKNKDRWFELERGLAIFNLCDSPISCMKAQTALYKLIGANDDMAQMALSNKFAGMDMEFVKPQDYRNLEPWFAIDDMFWYRLRNDKNQVYCCNKNYGIPEAQMYRGKDQRGLGMKQFQIKLNVLWYKDRVTFDTFNSKLKFKTQYLIKNYE